MVVSLLGASGHMGFATLKEFLKIKAIDLIKVLLLAKNKQNKLVKRLAKKNPKRIEIIYGDIAKYEDVDKMVKGSDYLFNLAAIIPPKSDKYPHLSYLVNELGTINVVKAIENHPQIKLIDITSVALYGSRNHLHPFIRIGDPVMPSVYDVYAAHKMRSEYQILESNIEHFVVIRQTAMLHKEMLFANLSDGLLFHTPFNSPLEWSTAEDSGLLMANIIKEDLQGHLTKDNFWNKIFNLGGGLANRITGYETFEGGFRLIGAETKNIFCLNDNVIRNFHGGYYFDGAILEDMFHYQRHTIVEYWQKIKKSYPILKLGRLLSQSVLKKLVIKRLYRNNNSPKYWYKEKDHPRMTAFFGSIEQYEKLSPSWDDFKLWDYQNHRDLANYKKDIDYGFDIEKSDKDITIEDLRNVALLHGGKLLSNDFKTGDVYTKLLWENSDKVKFTSKPYTIIRGGHWYNPLYQSNTWDFDRLAKSDKIFRAYWYDSHHADENNCYYMDQDYQARIK